MLDESGSDEVECSRKVASGRKAANAIRSIVTAWTLCLECVRVLNEAHFVSVFKYRSEPQVFGREEKI